MLFDDTIDTYHSYASNTYFGRFGKKIQWSKKSEFKDNKFLKFHKLYNVSNAQLFIECICTACICTLKLRYLQTVFDVLKVYWDLKPLHDTKFPINFYFFYSIIDKTYIDTRYNYMYNE